MSKQSIDTMGQYMLGQDAEGNPVVVLVDEDGKLLTSSGAGGDNVTIVGDTVGLAKAAQFPAALVDAGLRVSGAVTPAATINSTGANSLRTASILYGQDGANTNRLGAVSDALKVTNVNDGVMGTGMTPPSGGSGIIGFLSGIFNVVTALLSSKRPALTGSGGSILAANTSQVAVAASTKNFLMIQNISSGDLWFGFAGAAVMDDVTSFKLLPGERMTFDSNVPSTAIRVIGATVGQKFSITYG